MSNVIMRHGDGSYLSEELDELTINQGLNFEDSISPLVSRVLDPENNHPCALTFQTAVEALKSIYSETKPERVVSSDALRTQLTAYIVARGIGYEGEVEADRRVWDTIPSEYLQEGIMVVGHEPSISDFVSRPQFVVPYQIFRESTGLRAEKLV
jgi:hypothetical protein